MAQSDGITPFIDIYENFITTVQKGYGEMHRLVFLMRSGPYELYLVQPINGCQDKYNNYKKNYKREILHTGLITS